jgi:hypothetical protein
MDWTLLCFFTLPAVHSHLTDVKPSVSAMVGTNATLPCTTSLPLPVSWIFDTGDYRIVFKGNPVLKYAHKYSVQKSSVDRAGSFDLVIHNVEMSDAGNYSCRESGRSVEKQKYTTTLLVEESGAKEKGPQQMQARPVFGAYGGSKVRSVDDNANSMNNSLPQADVAVPTALQLMTIYCVASVTNNI